MEHRKLSRILTAITVIAVLIIALITTDAYFSGYSSVPGYDDPLYLALVWVLVLAFAYKWYRL